MSKGEALAGVTLGTLKFEGKRLAADVVEAVTDAKVTRTIEGASTITLILRDTHRTLLRSGLFGSRVTTQVDRFSFELVQVRKSGHDLTVTFEDLAVAALRRRDAPRKVAPGTTTRVDFARTLVSEEPWVKFHAPYASPSRAKVEMARGRAGSPGEEEEREDTWETLGRLADEVGWRRFARDGAIWFAPETWLIKQPTTYRFTEYKNGVDFIDFDFDIGKPVATATLEVRAERWAAPPGTPVELYDVGAANGRWLVSKIERSLFSPTATATLTKARPVLPEPDPPPAPVSAEALGPEGAAAGNPGEGASVDTGGVSTAGYIWPVRGTVSSGFGQRAGRLHAGIDIAVPVGTPVVASLGGTVTFAGEARGYGYVVYLRHSNGATTRYAHLSRIGVRRGQTVGRGGRLGLSGGARGAPGAGTSTGPHLHFELRPGDKPADPMKYLPPTGRQRDTRRYR